VTKTPKGRRCLGPCRRYRPYKYFDGKARICVDCPGREPQGPFTCDCVTCGRRFHSASPRALGCSRQCRKVRINEKARERYARHKEGT
jgi:endogenous inhibitor of DNA gyrase (YacG/DUF329 family)